MKQATVYLVGWELLNSKKNEPFYVLHIVHNCRCYVSYADPDVVDLKGLNREANEDKSFYLANISYFFENFKMRVVGLEVQTE